jgi:hypothetical protein
VTDASVPHLRVVTEVNPDTGEVIEPTCADCRELTVKLAHTEAALATLARTNSALRGEISKHKKREADAEQVREVMEYWWRHCRKSNKAVKIPLDCERAKRVRKMLESFSVDELKEAIDGARTMPFERYGHRYCEAGEGRVRRDDLEFICADVRRVEGLRAVAGSDAGHRGYKAFVWDCIQRDERVLHALALLGQTTPHGEALAQAASWAYGKLRGSQ